MQRARFDDDGAGACRRAQIAVWAGWLAVYWLALSFAGGVFHTYYLAVLGPPLAALAGIGMAQGWRRWRAYDLAPFLLPALVLAGLAWQAGLVWRRTGLALGEWPTSATLAMLALTAVPAIAIWRFGFTAAPRTVTV